MKKNKIISFFIRFVYIPLMILVSISYGSNSNTSPSVKASSIKISSHKTNRSVSKKKEKRNNNILMGEKKSISKNISFRSHKISIVYFDISHATEYQLLSLWKSYNLTGRFFLPPS